MLKLEMLCQKGVTDCSSSKNTHTHNISQKTTQRVKRRILHSRCPSPYSEPRSVTVTAIIARTPIVAREECDRTEQDTHPSEHSYRDRRRARRSVERPTNLSKEIDRSRRLKEHQSVTSSRERSADHLYFLELLHEVSRCLRMFHDGESNHKSDLSPDTIDAPNRCILPYL